MWMAVGSEGLDYLERSSFSFKLARAEALADFIFNANDLMCSASHFG